MQKYRVLPGSHYCLISRGYFQLPRGSELSVSGGGARFTVSVSGCMT